MLRRRVLERLMRAGVTVVDPASTWVEPGVRVGGDSVLLPGTALQGRTVIGARLPHRPAHPDPGQPGRAGERRHATAASSRRRRSAPRCHVGPFAHLRPGTRLAAGVRVGNFVETKKARLGAGAKASHLSYLGDAEIGGG